jgi:hypothetical protein
MVRHVFVHGLGDSAPVRQPGGMVSRIVGLARRALRAASSVLGRPVSSGSAAIGCGRLMPSESTWFVVDEDEGL